MWDELLQGVMKNCAGAANSEPQNYAGLCQKDCPAQSAASFFTVSRDTAASRTANMTGPAACPDESQLDNEAEDI